MIGNSVSTPCSDSVPKEIQVFRGREWELSIVIPTYNEAENIGALIQRILRALQRRAARRIEGRIHKHIVATR